MPDAPDDPGHEVLARPSEVLGTRLPPWPRLQRLGVPRFEAVLDAEGVEDRCRDRGVTGRRVVEPVGCPHPRIPKHAERPHVRDQCAVLQGDRMEMLVVDRSLAANERKDGGHAHVRPGEEHDGGTISPERADEAVEALRDLVRVGAGADDVIPARRDGDQVGVKCKRTLGLLVDDLLEQPPPDGEVRVGEVVRLIRENLGDPVGPAAKPTGHRRVRITDPLGERVTDCDVSGPRMTTFHASEN